MTLRTLITAGSALALLAIATTSAAIQPESDPNLSYVNTEPVAPTITRTHQLPDAATIAVARVELGRLIPIPHPEQFRWADMEKRTGDRFELLHPGAYLDMVPEIDFDGHDTDNKLDEMRLASVEAGYDYLMIYGLGEDALPGSFARRPLSRTGFSIPKTGDIHRGGEAKAVIVDTRTGRVLGATTAPMTDRYISLLSDAVAELVNEL